MCARGGRGRSLNGLSRKKLFVISGIPFVTPDEKRETWAWNEDRRRGARKNEEKEREKRGGRMKRSSTADGATKITENPRRLRATWFVPCVSSTRSSSSTLLLVYSCVPRPPLPFHLRLFRLFIIEHLVIHYISHGPLFFFLQSCRFLPYRGTSRHNHGEPFPLPPFQTTAGDHEREREGESLFLQVCLVSLFARRV